MSWNKSDVSLTCSIAQSDLQRWQRNEPTKLEWILIRMSGSWSWLPNKSIRIEEIYIFYNKLYNVYNFK